MHVIAWKNETHQLVIRNHKTLYLDVLISMLFRPSIKQSTELKKLPVTRSG